ncbi:MAG: hypothetical protein NWE89_12745 [Candidatus Bathyarchaeota archaeon]|nr:hypothetical protein [Candidatus Bathyarchaeota archaeon]
MTECIVTEKEVLEDPTCYTLEGVLTVFHLRDIELKKKNQVALTSIQEILMTEEDRVYSVEETLDRVLGFYKRFVPYT